MPIASVESVRESSGKPYEKHQVDITGRSGLPLNSERPKGWNVLRNYDVNISEHCYFC
jgi:hypothetical protein